MAAVLASVEAFPSALELMMSRLLISQSELAKGETSRSSEEVEVEEMDVRGGGLASRAISVTRNHTTQEKNQTTNYWF
jgi:hypothetical protein